MAYSPPYVFVNGKMILVLAYKNGFKSKSVYYGLLENTFLFMALDVGLLTSIFLFMI